MRTWLGALRDTLFLRTAAFERVRGERDAAWQGFLLVVAVSLILAAPALIRGLASDLSRSGAVEPTELTTSAGVAIDQLAGALTAAGIAPEQQTQMFLGVETALQVLTQSVERVAALPTHLPAPWGAVLRRIGGWLSSPWAGGPLPLTAATVSIWLSFGAGVMLFAALLGGRGSLASFFGLTAFFALPHLLSLLGWLPFVERAPLFGVLLGWIVFLWSAAIYARATMVSHRLPLGRALLAMALPPVVMCAGVILALLGIWLAVVIGLLVR